MMAAANNIASTGIVLEPLRKGNYENWSTLVRSYLVGKGLWEGIVTFGPPKRDGGEINDDDWTSKNAKALHAIQLACGSENLSNIRTFENARDAWNRLNISFSEDVSAFPDFEEQRPESESPETAPEAEITYEPADNARDARNHLNISSFSEIPESEAEAEAQPECAASTWINELHSAVSKGKWNAAKAYIRRHGIRAILSTTPPLGRTILHIAVATGREKIVAELIYMRYHDQLEIQQLLRMQDKRGYTALALAAELTDNAYVAVWMIDKGGKDLLSIKTKDKGEIPLLLAAAKGHKRMTRYLFSQTSIDDDFVSSDDGRVFLWRCISAEIFDVAACFLQDYLGLMGYHLRYGKHPNEQHPIMALAHMPSAFPSGAQLGWWNRFIYNSLRLERHTLLYGRRLEIVLHDEPADEEADTNTLANLLANLSTTHPLGRIFRSMVSAVVPVKPLSRRFGQFLASIPRILPGSQKIYEMKLNHYLVHGILEWVSKVISKCDETDPRICSADDVMLLAAKYGIIELIESLMLANPSLLWDMNDNKKSILAQAICHRQEKVFQLILGIQGRQKEILISHIDLHGNKMLHLAAELGHSSYLNRMSNPALQMQRELQWFQAVERIVPSKYKEAKNNDGLTPHELFTKKHEDLMKAGEQWARDTASSFIVVGTLIVTIMFAAAFTVPGGNDQNTGIPIFLKRRAFLVFIIADIISFVMSSSSVLIFIEILTFRYAMKDFLKSLRKILWGLFALFFSVTSMMLTFVAALSLMLKEYPGAIAAAASLASIPVLVLIHTLLSLSYEILKSTTWTLENKYLRLNSPVKLPRRGEIKRKLFLSMIN